MNSEAWIEAADEFEQWADSCEGALQSFILGMRRQSATILDNIGITLKLAEMPSWSERQRAYNAAYGDSLLSDARCRLRSWLFPNRHEVLVQAYQAARCRVQAEMLNFVISQGEEMVGERQTET